MVAKHGLPTTPSPDTPVNDEATTMQGVNSGFCATPSEPTAKTRDLKAPTILPLRGGSITHHASDTYHPIDVLPQHLATRDGEEEPDNLFAQTSSYPAANVSKDLAALEIACTNSGVLECGMCGLLFGDAGALAAHMLALVPVEEEHECSCGRRFGSTRALQQHLQSCVALQMTSVSAERSSIEPNSGRTLRTFSDSVPPLSAELIV